MTVALDWMAGGTVLALTAGASPPPPPAYNVVAVGDSITSGVMATLPYPNDLATVFGATANLGVPLIGWAWNPSGVRSAPSLISTAAADVYPLIAGPNYPWLIGFAGTNDGEYGDTAAVAWASAQTWIEGVLATGFPANRLIIPTMLPRTNLEPFRTAYNALLVAGAATYGYQCARLDLDPNIGQAGDNLNPTYYEQTYSVHPTNAGHQIIANIIGALMANVLPALPPPVVGTYFVRSDGADTNDGYTKPWLTVSAAEGAPLGSKVYFWGGETFQCPSGYGVYVGPGTTWDSFGTGQATILSNNNGIGGCMVVDGGTVGAGIKVWGDGGNTWNGVDMVSTTGLAPAFHGRVGGFYNLGSTNDFGRDVNVACANANLTGAIIGGETPADLDQNGITFNGASGKVSGFTIQNIGGDPRNPTQTGFGWHTNLSWNGPNGTAVPFTYTNGVPNNASLEICNFTIHDCGWNMTSSGGGGPSGGEVGAGGGVYIHDFVIYNIRPNPATFQGGSDFTPLDVGDDGAQYTLAERGLVYNCYGGIEDYANGGPGQWGPSIVRYILSVNCGQGQPGAAIVQGNGNSGVHQWYNNTFIQTEDANIPEGSNKNVVFWQMQNGAGIYANNIAVTGYPWYALLADQLPGAGFVATNNGWYGAGAGFSVAGQVSQTIPAFVAANARTDNPLFMGSAGSLVQTDYVLQAGSPYRGAGINVAAVYGLDIGSTDLFGHPVNPAVAPHIGAHAFG